MKSVYEAVRASPQWDESLLLITYVQSARHAAQGQRTAFVSCLHVRVCLAGRAWRLLRPREPANTQRPQP